MVGMSEPLVKRLQAFLKYNDIDMGPERAADLWGEYSEEDHLAGEVAMTPATLYGFVRWLRELTAVEPEVGSP